MINFAGNRRSLVFVAAIRNFYGAQAEPEGSSAPPYQQAAGTSSLLQAHEHKGQCLVNQLIQQTPLVQCSTFYFH